MAEQNPTCRNCLNFPSLVIKNTNLNHRQDEVTPVRTTLVYARRWGIVIPQLGDWVGDEEEAQPASLDCTIALDGFNNQKLLNIAYS